MCDELADLEWTPIGVVTWQGSVCTIEFCSRCGEYRARMLDVNEIEVVEGAPDVAGPQADAQSDGDAVESAPGRTGHPDDEAWSAGDERRDDDDGDDWLVK